MKWRVWWRRLIGAPVAQVDGKELARTIEPKDEIDSTVKIGAWVLLGGFGGFMLWAILAPLDEGVPAQGTVMVDTKRKTIQHLTGGLIDKVLVREGQMVQAGDVLIKLNEAQAKAEFESARQRYLGLRAHEDRLLAEQGGLAHVSFHPDVLTGKDDPLLSQHIRTQEQLLVSRRLALKSEQASINEATAAQLEAAKGFSAQLASRQQQLAYLQEERTGLRDLVKEGYAPRNKLLEIERLIADIEATTSELRANLAMSKRSAAELTLRRLQREQEFRKEVDTQLAEVRREVNADEERFKATREALARSEIKAPVSGAVVGIATQTVGGVIPQGARIMDIVPKDEMLMLEAQIPPHLIDRVRVGQFADIRFSNFSLTPQLVIEGELISVSADLLSNPENNIAYYLARVAVTPRGLQALGSHQLQPGMPAEIVIKTGERSLLAYLLHPLTRRLAQAMKEE
ncbi:MAG TPA: HlyD family type I secretion periplasmic adaptor subunit [Azonexus sp.]|nr:HlyD family type I secretion periplasmic adaptor subunit [Azonexus sp.]